MTVMDEISDEFEPSPASIWLNTAHQGRLSRRAARAVGEAVHWKLHPELLTPETFAGVPAAARHALARLLGAHEDDVVLANSASYGLHLVANGLDLAPGDEVVVAANDFPSDILPWLLLRDRGVRVRMVVPERMVLTADEVEAALTDRTRVVCLTWVHSFSGHVVGLDAIGRVCRRAGVWFVVNASQALGVRPLAVDGLPVDALVSVGFKWLCGPYGTGVCWLHPQLRVLEVGVERIERFVDGLVLALLAEIDRERYRPVSSEQIRSSLILLEPLVEPLETVFDRLRAAGVHVARRAGRLRVSPHVYNTRHDIDRLLEVL